MPEGRLENLSSFSVRISEELGIAATVATPECTQEGKREFPGVFSLLSSCWDSNCHMERNPLLLHQQ